MTAQLLIRIRTNLRFGAFDFVKRPDGQIIFPRNEPEWSVHLIRKSWLERKNLFQTFDHKTELEIREEIKEVRTLLDEDVIEGMS